MLIAATLTSGSSVVMIGVSIAGSVVSFVSVGVDAVSAGSALRYVEDADS